MEKEHQPDSMATVTMKADYAPSEVYSASEPPPAYRHPKSSAVQIAKIVGGTIIISSLLLGSFILASTYVQARAGCHQLEQLDAMLEKELALEARQMQAEALMQDEPLPLHSAQALLQDLPKQNDLKQKKTETLKAEESMHDEDKLQSLDNDSQQEDSDESNDSSMDEQGESGDDSEEREPIRITLPLQLDFDELAGALMEKNQRSRMNCIVEKRKAEEFVNHQSKSVQLPFGLNLTTDPRLQKVTGERMAIFCESGNEQREIPENVEVMGGRNFPIPLGGPVRLPLNFPINPQVQYHRQQQQQQQQPPIPLQHMQAPQMSQREFRFIPQQRGFAPEFAPRFQPQEMRFQESQESQPQPEMEFQHPRVQIQRQEMPVPLALIPREVRIHVQRIQLPQVDQEHVPQDSHMSQEEAQPELQMQGRLPFPMISPAELRAVQQAVRVAEAAAEQQMVAQQQQQQQQQQQENDEGQNEMLGRQAMARALPVNIPVPMMIQDEGPVQQPDSERPHFVQPRSVRSVDALLKREKRVKRSCSCDCAC